MSSLKLSLVPLLMLSMGSPAWAQNGVSQASTPATGAVGTHTAQDVRFVTAASAAGDTEIMAARLAQTQGKSAKVKSFAATMLADHGKANDQLKDIAQKDGYTISMSPTSDQQNSLAKLRSLHGKDFDTAYTQMMMKDHRDAVALFQTESTSGMDGDLKSFAAHTLPTLQHHLALANAL